jgi:hypothetical protein
MRYVRGRWAQGCGMSKAEQNHQAWPTSRPFSYFLLAVTFMAYVYFENLVPTSRIADSSIAVCNTSSNNEATQEQFVIQKERPYVLTCSIWPSLVAYRKMLLWRTMASEADIRYIGRSIFSVAFVIENRLLSTAR